MLRRAGLDPYDGVVLALVRKMRVRGVPLKLDYTLRETARLLGWTVWRTRRFLVIGQESLPDSEVLWLKGFGDQSKFLVQLTGLVAVFRSPGHNSVTPQANQEPGPKRRRQLGIHSQKEISDERS